MSNDRKAWIAAILGLAYPGLGHLYAGRLRSAVALMASVPLLLGPLLVAGAVHLPRPLNVVAWWGGVVGVLLLGSVGGARAARRAPRPFRPGHANRWWVYAGLILLAAFVLAPLSGSVSRRYVGESGRIPFGAMEPTVLAGDFLFVDRNTRPPAPGDIVAFRSVEEPGLTVLRRAVAVGGDTIEMRAGQLLRNGQVVVEPHAVSTDPATEADPRRVRQMLAWQAPRLARDTAGYLPSLRTWGPIIIPPNTFFDLGDNRDASYDGRYYGPVPVTNVVGRPRTVYYSFDPSSYRPVAVVTSVRWGRLGFIPQ